MYSPKELSEVKFYGLNVWIQFLNKMHFVHSEQSSEINVAQA